MTSKPPPRVVTAVQDLKAGDVIVSYGKVPHGMAPTTAYADQVVSEVRVMPKRDAFPADVEVDTDRASIRFGFGQQLIVERE